MKKLIIILTALSLAVSMSACHGSRGLPEFTVPEALDEAGQYELVFWAKNDNNMTQRAIYEKAMADFMALYPNVKVSMRLYTDYSRIYNDVITNISTLTTPNVCITYPDHIATYLTGSNVVAPLDALIGNASYGLSGSALRFTPPGEVVGKFLEEGKIGGTQYAIPFMRSTEACYINADFVRALGYEVPDVLTWDFIWEVSEKAIERNADGVFKLNGQKVLIPCIYKSTDNMMIQYLRQKGAGYSTDDGEIAIFNDETRALLYEVAEHVKSGAFSTFKISSYPGNFLNAGQCVFAIDSTAGATWMGSDAPLFDISEDAIVDFETAVRPIPQTDPASPSMISQGPSICVFNKSDPQEVLYSWLFAQFLLTNSVQVAYSQTEGYVPVTLAAQGCDEYVDYMSRSGEDNDLYYNVKLDAAKLLIANTDRTFTTPVFNGSASLRSAAGQLIENTAKSVRRGETIDDGYMDRLFDDVTSLYRLSERGAADAGKRELGPMPAMSAALLVSLAAIWLVLGLYALILLLKIRKKERNGN